MSTGTHLWNCHSDSNTSTFQRLFIDLIDGPQRNVMVSFLADPTFTKPCLKIPPYLIAINDVGLTVVQQPVTRPEGKIRALELFEFTWIHCLADVVEESGIELALSSQHEFNSNSIHDFCAEIEVSGICNAC